MKIKLKPLTKLTEEDNLKIEAFMDDNKGLLNYYTKRFNNKRFDRSDFRQQVHLGICQAFINLKRRKYRRLNSIKNKNAQKYFVTFFIKKRIADLFESTKKWSTNFERTTKDLEIKHGVVPFSLKEILETGHKPVLINVDNGYLDKFYRKS